MNKGDAKGESPTSSSSNVPETILSLVSPDCLKEFEEKHQNQLVMKQRVYKPATGGTLNIPNVVSLTEHQQINYFLKLSSNYNEDLIHVFYSRLHKRHGSTFKFKLGNTNYAFSSALWISLFGIIAC